MLGTLLLSMAIMGVIGLIGFIWGLWVSGTAASVANDISVGEGVLSYFISEIIIIAIMVGVTTALAFFLYLLVAGFL